MFFRITIYLIDDNKLEWQEWHEIRCSPSGDPESLQIDLLKVQQRLIGLYGGLVDNESFASLSLSLNFNNDILPAVNFIFLTSDEVRELGAYGLTMRLAKMLQNALTAEQSDPTAISIPDYVRRLWLKVFKDFDLETETFLLFC